MIYRAIGVMSGSSLDGLDISYAEFTEIGGKWNYEILSATCIPYNEQWVNKLTNATSLSALDYQLLHTEFGHYIGRCINDFIASNNLHFKVALVASHGHTTFHIPSKKMTSQLGDGGAIAASTKLPVVTDLRALDVALGGQGAPIVPIGEKLLLHQYAYLLNIGGIANISINGDEYKAFDVCPANRVLNMLANEAGRNFDENGNMARAGNIHPALLNELNGLEYYAKQTPKSLANDFGTEIVYPIIKKYPISIVDALATYVGHITTQIRNAIKFHETENEKEKQLLVTGGGAFNTFLVEQLQQSLEDIDLKVIVPDDNLVKYKEALIMALIGVLRWREEYNVLSSVTGAARDSVGGAMWMGQEE